VQASCPNCSQKIVIDDAKVPDRAFSVKCPKCQNVVKFPGRSAAPAPAPAASAAIGAEEEDWTRPASGTGESQSLPSIPASGKTLGQGLKAVIALGDRQLASTVSNTLGQLGYAVDILDNVEEGGRLIEQGVYALAVTAQGGGGAGKETLLQRIQRLSPDSRRRVFLTLLGEEYKTGDGVQAWSATADLVVNPRDAAGFAGVLANTVAERGRVYQVYVDARRRFEEASS
jgi:predicted Zn finger-like uncharacterized protein